MRLSIVIPVYNEQAAIEAVIESHLRVLAQHNFGLQGFEIVCLDDASTDQTWSILNSCALKHKELRLLRHDANQGISRSFTRLFHEARGDFIYLTAGDGQWPAENLATLLRAQQAAGVDLVVGVRRNRGQVYGPWRKALSFGFNWLAKILLQVDARDVNGIKLGRKEILARPVASKSFFAEIERLALAQAKGRTIIYEPVEFVTRFHGQAKGARMGNILETLTDALRFILNKKRRVCDGNN